MGRISLYKVIGSSSYNAYSEAPTWLQMLGSGVFTMVWTAVVAFLIAFFIRFSPRVIRTLPNKPLAFIGNCYVEIFRNIPLIVQLFFWAFVFPEFLPDSLSAGSGDVVAGVVEKPSKSSSCCYWCFCFGSIYRSTCF